MINAGARGNFDAFVQLRADGVEPSYVASLRRSGHDIHDPDDLVQLKTTGVTARDLMPVRSPRPPNPPKAPPPPLPRDWVDDHHSDPGDG
jgi:hypothetical protein